MTTAELMAGSGLKYAHATRRGNQGQDGDLEKSRKKLLDFGFVDKANIEVDPEEGISVRYAYQKALEENETLNELKRMHDKTESESGKAFDEWYRLKGLKDTALKYLSAIDSPVLPDEEGNMLSSTRAESKGATKTIVTKGPIIDDCIAVGKALKKVDRSLLPDWTKWCAGVIPAFQCTVLWDHFYPMACDIHGVLGSQVRETFLRILKPGLNFKETFKNFAERKLQRLEQVEGMEYRGEDRVKMINETKLNRKEMTALLRDLGVSMKPHEINALIDAFDSNGDGVVTMQEFVEFTGPRRSSNAGAFASLSQKCCWRTTCKTVRASSLSLSLSLLLPLCFLPFRYLSVCLYMYMFVHMPIVHD
jgi:hypothetical protein